MDAKDAQELFRGSQPQDWLMRARNASAERGVVVLDESAEKFFGKALAGHVKSGAVTNGAGVAGAALILSGGAVLRSTYFADALRPSVYQETVLETLAQTLVLVIEIVLENGIGSPELDRLNSLSNYVQLYTLTRRDEEALLVALHLARETSVRSVLCLAERAFLSDAIAETVPLPPTFDLLSREDVANGASYAIEAYNNRYGLRVAEFRRSSDGDAVPEDFESLVLEAHRLRELIGLEACVYRMEYHCERMKPNAYRIYPPSPEFGMALSLGYIRHANLTPPNAEGAQSFRAYCDAIADGLGHKMFRLSGSTSEASALRFEIPLKVMRALTREVFLKDEFFEEEVKDLGIVCRELMVSPEQLQAFEIVPHLRFADVLRIQRYFRFFAYIRARELSADKYDDRTWWNSLIGGATNAELIKKLSQSGFAERTARAFVGTFSWEAEKRRFLDLQYSPLLKFGTGDLAIPFFILGRSNLVRNGLQITRRRFYPDGAEDPVVSLLVAALLEAGAAVKSNVVYEFEGVSGEIDVLAVIEGSAFVFECKNTLLPCSPFELRTTWDYVNYASTQLDRVRGLWSQPRFREEVGRTMGIDDMPAASPATCIVLNHRLLSGSSFRNHPIRQLREIENLIRTGRGHLVAGGVEIPIQNWIGESFSADDLKNYLDVAAKIYKCIWSAFHSNEAVVMFKECSLSVARYALNPFDQIVHLGVLDPLLTERLRSVSKALTEAEVGYDRGTVQRAEFERTHEAAMTVLAEVTSALGKMGIVRPQ